MKDNNKLGIKYAINKSLQGFHPVICRPCKKTYLEGAKIKKCTKCGERVDKVRTSVRYLQNRLEDVEIKVLEFPTSIYYFLAFTIVVRDDLFREKIHITFILRVDKEIKNQIYNLLLNSIDQKF
ncbi:hypothetical protein [Candidatus Nitrosocosmicus sp. R]